VNVIATNGTKQMYSLGFAQRQADSKELLTSLNFATEAAQAIAIA